MKECDVLGVKHTLTPPTYFQGVRSQDPQPPWSTPLNGDRHQLFTWSPQGAILQYFRHRLPHYIKQQRLG